MDIETIMTRADNWYALYPTGRGYWTVYANDPYRVAGDAAVTYCGPHVGWPNDEE